MPWEILSRHVLVFHAQQLGIYELNRLDGSVEFILELRTGDHGVETVADEHRSGAIGIAEEAYEPNEMYHFSEAQLNSSVCKASIRIIAESSHPW
jgi:hypothetical protein